MGTMLITTAFVKPAPRRPRPSKQLNATPPSPARRRRYNPAPPLSCHLERARAFSVISSERSESRDPPKPRATPTRATPPGPAATIMKGAPTCSEQ